MKDRVENPALANYPYINQALMKFAEQAHRVAFASVVGLTSNPDNLHFNRESLLEFGLRYYAAFKTVEDRDRVFDEKSKMDDAIRTELELL